MINRLTHGIADTPPGPVAGIFSFYYPNGNPGARTAETAAALATGAAVRRELTPKTTSEAGIRKR
jgi:hypothetical protein